MCNGCRCPNMPLRILRTASTTVQASCFTTLHTPFLLSNSPAASALHTPAAAAVAPTALLHHHHHHHHRVDWGLRCCLRHHLHRLYACCCSLLRRWWLRPKLLPRTCRNLLLSAHSSKQKGTSMLMCRDVCKHENIDR